MYVCEFLHLHTQTHITGTLNLAAKKHKEPTADGIPLQSQVRAPAEYEDMAEYSVPAGEGDPAHQGSPAPSHARPGGQHSVYQELSAANADYTTVYQPLVSGGGRAGGRQEYSEIDISTVDPPSDYAVEK